MKESWILIAVMIFAGSAYAGDPVDSPAPGTVTNRAAKVPVGKFFLLRHGVDHAAVKLTSVTTKGDGGVAYTWHAQSDGSGIFTNAKATHGDGEVFEKYRRTPTDNGFKVEDIGSSLHIECGRIRVAWSRSNWIYLNSPTGPVEIAFTEETTVEKINYLDPQLTWHRPKDTQKIPTTVIKHTR